MRLNLARVWHEPEQQEKDCNCGYVYSVCSLCHTVYDVHVVWSRGRRWRRREEKRAKAKDVMSQALNRREEKESRRRRRATFDRLRSIEYIIDVRRAKKVEEL